MKPLTIPYAGAFWLVAVVFKFTGSVLTAAKAYDATGREVTGRYVEKGTHMITSRERIHLFLVTPQRAPKNERVDTRGRRFVWEHVKVRNRGLRSSCFGEGAAYLARGFITTWIVRFPLLCCSNVNSLYSQASLWAAMECGW